MKQILSFLGLGVLSLSMNYAYGQCTTALINWDNLEVVYSGASPYTGYVTSAQEQSQRFAIGKTNMTLATNNVNLIGTVGETAAHTGDIANYTGEDVQFTPTATGQTVTLTFDLNVTSVSFTIYDMDNNGRMDVTAANAAGTALVPTFSNAGSGITISNSGTTTPQVRSTNVNAANNVNTHSVTINVAGPVRTISLNISTLGSDPVFWLSDIRACVPGTFPTNYHQMATTKPFSGQPDYFLVTPNNNWCYMVDPATGRAWRLFRDSSVTLLNSLAYNPVDHIVYYVGDNTGSASTNFSLRKYDCQTYTVSILTADIRTLGIPLFDWGIESGGASFYDGALYLGIEGGRYGADPGPYVTRESVVYRINFDASGNPTTASQVFGVNSYNTSDGTVMTHDWGDFLVKDGMVINFNSARAGAAPSATFGLSSAMHYNLWTGNFDVINMNPNPSMSYVNQIGMTWAGQIYNFWWNSNLFAGGIQTYAMDGTLGPNQNITAVAPATWPGNAGDATEPFRPLMDFGDAPASYDPATGDPAVHEMSTTLRLGNLFDREVDKMGVIPDATADGADEDGLPYVHIYNPTAGNYLTAVNVYNNTGATVPVVAWLDHNGNGTFEAAEGIQVDVASSASVQMVYLYWTGVPSTLVTGTWTYLRIRTARTGLSVANPTGYLATGEVEDHRVPVNYYPLAVTDLRFEADMQGNDAVRLSWSLSGEESAASYVVERSTDGKSWKVFNGVQAEAGKTAYNLTDRMPIPGTSWYRLRVLNTDGTVQMSEAKKVRMLSEEVKLRLTPNPAITRATVHVSTAVELRDATLEVVGMNGAVLQRKVVTIAPGITSLELPVDRLPAGRYLVRVLHGARPPVTESLIIKR